MPQLKFFVRPGSVTGLLACEEAPVPTSPHSKVLVTGANGFIAMGIIRSLLEQEYSMRGAVRTKEKSALLEELFASYAERFEVVVVLGITKHSFDLSLTVHKAYSIAHYSIESQQPSQKAHETSLPRLPQAPSYASSPSLMSAASVEAKVMKIKMRRQNGENEDKDEPTEMEMYWRRRRWPNETQPNCRNKQPPLYNAISPSDLNDSLDWFYRSVIASSQGTSPETSLISEDKVVLPTEASEAYAAHMSPTVLYVNVCDLAQAHMLVLQNEEAGGGRIIVCAGRGTCRCSQHLFLPLTSPISRPLPKGIPGMQGMFFMQYDTSKADRALRVSRETGVIDRFAPL
ncbi:hypothetical protein BDQ12DRAFT_666053 [Crucibulum laeve]|uniref:NAD-dependent epimerase/dehydratase domain-containing protein n=1 Tax=Crucibulum laeve TaxID=68775 RepID=A0A5C3M0C3_9AGAR|nr:hypothetical protein BDQ12DRAFT_666053 [Crucibulum laeve]